MCHYSLTSTSSGRFRCIVVRSPSTGGGCFPVRITATQNIRFDPHREWRGIHRRQGRRVGIGFNFVVHFEFASFRRFSGEGHVNFGSSWSSSIFSRVRGIRNFASWWGAAVHGSYHIPLVSTHKILSPCVSDVAYYGTLQHVIYGCLG